MTVSQSHPSRASRASRVPGAAAPPLPPDSETESRPRPQPDARRSPVTARAAEITQALEAAGAEADQLARMEQGCHAQLRALLVLADDLCRTAVADPDAFEPAVTARVRALASNTPDFTVSQAARRDPLALVVALVFPKFPPARRSTYLAALRRLAVVAGSNAEAKRLIDTEGVEKLARAPRTGKPPAGMAAVRSGIRQLEDDSADAMLALPDELLAPCDVETVALLVRQPDGRAAVWVTSDAAALRATVKALTQARGGASVPPVAEARPPRSVGAWIAGRCRELGLSLDDVAQRSAMHPQTVRRFARDSVTPGKKAYARLCAVLGTPPA